MAPLELYQKIYVAPSFMETPHGEIPCEDCHGGNPKDNNWQTAHNDIIRDPSFVSADRVCGDCHREIVESATKSLHYTLTPFFTTILARAEKKDPETSKTLEKSIQKHCGGCHSSCGQCHISRPDYVKGGFLSKHHFNKTPPMNTSCASCHGGRVHGEFTGVNSDFEPDTHFEDEEMTCTSCHNAKEMHADKMAVNTRYDLPQRPRCIQCHKDIFSEDSSNKTHEAHGQKLACQVCHGQANKNCFSCHVGTDKKGLPYFKCDKTEFLFKIGLNPRKTRDFPYDFVVLRHVPTARDTFDFYLHNGLGNFYAMPTWKPDTPHNIRKKTKQNQSCNNCHGNPGLFLQEKDLSKEERTANKDVIVPVKRIPQKIPE